MSMQDGTFQGRPFYPGLAFSPPGSSRPTAANCQQGYQDQILAYASHKWLNPAENTKYYVMLKSWGWSGFYHNDDSRPSSPTDNNDSNYDWAPFHAVVDWAESKGVKVFFRLDSEGDSQVPGFVDQFDGKGGKNVPSWHRSQPVTDMKNFITAFQKEFGQARTALTCIAFIEDSKGPNPPSDLTEQKWRDGREEVVRFAYNTFINQTVLLYATMGARQQLLDLPLGFGMADPKLGMGGCGSSSTPFPTNDCGNDVGLYSAGQTLNGTISNPWGNIPSAFIANAENNGWKTVGSNHSCHNPWGKCMPIAGETSVIKGETRNISSSTYLWYFSGPPRASSPQNNSNLGASGADKAGVMPAMIIFFTNGVAMSHWAQGLDRFTWRNGQGTNAVPALPYDWLDGSAPPFQLRNDSLATVDKNAPQFSVPHTTLLVNDIGSNLVFDSVSNATNCQVVNTFDSVLVTVNSNFIGTATFAYTASSGSDSGQALVSIPVQNTTPGANPEALNDTLAGVAQNSSNIVIDAATLMANDSGVSIALLSVQNSIGCIVSLDKCSQQVTFRPTTNFSGVATFDYTILSEKIEYISTATVSIQVGTTSGGVIANADVLPSVSVNASPFAVLEATLLANDTGDNLYVTGVSNALGCSVSFNTISRATTVTPDFNYAGTARFNYAVSGDTGDSSAQASFVISSSRPTINDPGLLQTDFPNPITFQLTGNDPDGGALTFHLDVAPGAGEGQVTVSPGGEAVYTPTGVLAPKLIESIKVSVSDTQAERSDFLTLRIQVDTGGVKLVTLDDLDATVVGAGWEKLSDIAGSGNVFSPSEGTGWFLSVSGSPVSQHSATIPATVPVGSTLLFIAAVGDQGAPALSFIDPAGWTWRVGGKFDDVTYRLADRVVQESDPGSTITVIKSGKTVPFISAFVVLPEGSVFMDAEKDAGSGTEASIPGVTTTEDGAIVFGFAARGGVNESQDDHIPLGMNGIFDRWTSSVGGQDSCQAILGYSLQTVAGAFPATTVTLDHATGWGTLTAAYSLGAGGGSGVPFTGAYLGDAYTHEASAEDAYLEYRVPSLFTKSRVQVYASWPDVGAVPVKANFEFEVGEQNYGGQVWDQQFWAGGDNKIIDRTDLPRGDIVLRIKVTEEARALADLVVINYVETEDEYDSRKIETTLGAFLQIARSESVSLAAYIIKEGETLSTISKTFSVVAHLDSGEAPTWRTLFKDEDTWLQERND